MRKLIWRKKWFGNTHELFEKNEYTGKFISKTFSNSGTGILDNTEVNFVTVGLFNQKTRLIDQNSMKIIGSISYNTFRTRAYIDIKDEYYEWRSMNWNNSRWSIFKNNNEIISSYNNMLNGEINDSINDPLLVLTGLFISEYFNKSYVAIFMVLFIIILTSNS